MIIKKIIIMCAGIIYSLHAHAGFSIGDAKSDLGELNLSGFARVKYQIKDFSKSAPDQKIEFETLIANLSYNSPSWFANAEYRCYQLNDLCDFSTLVTGYIGYKINAQDYISLGIQPIPFGPDRFWDSSFHESINGTLGLQDVNNLGIKYHIDLPADMQLDLSYFLQDGGNYRGYSQDSSRYSANLIQSGQVGGTKLTEKDMLIARLKQNLTFIENDNLNISVGASYWYSDIQNEHLNVTGKRKAWSIFNEVDFHQLNLKTVWGHLDLDHKDPTSAYFSTLGSFEAEYNVANEGYFYSIAAQYNLGEIYPNITLTPYAVYSGYDKKYFSNSYRNILGMIVNYKDFYLYAEYLLGKNDPFVGGDFDSLAQVGDSKWNKMLNFSLMYNF